MRIDDELVVVDDGSLEPISVNVDAATVYHRPALGPAAARNHGARMTTAEALVFIDADVVIPMGTLDALADSLWAAEEVAAVQGTYTWRCEAESNFVTRFMALLQHYNFSQARDPERFEGLSSFCVAIRRNHFEAAGGFDETLARATMEDDNLAAALLHRGHRIRLARHVEVAHLATFTPASLADRMRRMACDKVRSIGREPARARIRLSHSHHRPGFLLATALTPVGVTLLPVCPGLGTSALIAALLTHERFFRSAVRNYGVQFAAKASAMLWLLALAAAAGSAQGLWTYVLERN